MLNDAERNVEAQQLNGVVYTGRIVEQWFFRVFHYPLCIGKVIIDCGNPVLNEPLLWKHCSVTVGL